MWHVHTTHHWLHIQPFDHSWHAVQRCERQSDFSVYFSCRWLILIAVKTLRLASTHNHHVHVNTDSEPRVYSLSSTGCFIFTQAELWTHQPLEKQSTAFWLQINRPREADILETPTKDANESIVLSFSDRQLDLQYKQLFPLKKIETTKYWEYEVMITCVHTVKSALICWSTTHLGINQRVMIMH